MEGNESRLTTQAEIHYEKITEKERSLEPLFAFSVGCLKRKTGGLISKKVFREVLVGYCERHRFSMPSDNVIKRFLVCQGIHDMNKRYGGERVYSWVGICFHGEGIQIRNKIK